MNYEYAIVVTDKTRLDLLVERFNTVSQAKFYIERLGGIFEDYVIEDEIYKKAIDTVQINLSKIIKNKTIERAFLPSYIFSPNNIVIVVGRDGLVANTAKYINGVPIIAINPDSKRYSGVLLPFSTSDFHQGVDNVLSGIYKSMIFSFACAKLNDGQNLLAFNDLFIGNSSHVSARYKISFGEGSEVHSSSGIIVSTKAGSTGWMSSIFNMAYGVTGLFEKGLKLKQPSLRDGQLIFAVREPYSSISTQANINIGIVNTQKKLVIESLMPRNGVIFSDGIESDYLQFNSGSKVDIGLSDKTCDLVMKKG